METNIRDYPQYYWIIALTLDVIFNVTPVLVSFYSFWVERDKFFKDANFHNEAIEKYEKKKLKNKIKEEKQNKNIANTEKLPNINQQSINNNNNNVITINENNKNVQAEISFKHQKNLDEQKYTYQNYLKSSPNQLTQISHFSEHPHKSENVNIDSKNQLITNPAYTNVKFYSESNLTDSNNLKTNVENLNKNFGEDLKNIENIEKDLLRKYRKEIKCGFIITIAVLIIDCYSNIDTFINLKPRFLDTQYILFNNSYLVNEENLVYDKNFIYEKYLKNSAENVIINQVINTDKDTNEEDNDKKIQRDKSKKGKRGLMKLNYFHNRNKTLLENEKRKNEQLHSLQSKLDLNDSDEAEETFKIKNNFIYSNIQNYVNITLKPKFNISICKWHSEKDLEKISFIYKFSAVRYSLLIINAILDVFIMLLTTIGFLYKVEINKLYQSTFMVVMLFLLNKCWSMCAVAYSYFDFTVSDCLNAIDHFEVFFYAYLSYVSLFFMVIAFLIIYSLFCRQLLYYILMILVSGLTLFIPAIFCLDKQQKCMQRIYLGQEIRIKDDLEDIRNFRFKRKKQNCQLWIAYCVFLIIFLSGLSALLNFSILKYIWIENSWRTLAPAVGSIATFIATFFQRCYK